GDGDLHPERSHRLAAVPLSSKSRACPLGVLVRPKNGGAIHHPTPPVACPDHPVAALQNMKTVRGRAAVPDKYVDVFHELVSDAKTSTTRLFKSCPPSFG